MKHLSKQEYINKMRGCWLGKAIGGTLGAIFEARRGAFDIDYYTIDLKDGMLPNDDLDLQLVWLNAAERYGANLRAEHLADYWMLGIVPNWAEYGVGKSNLRLGLLPPVSGAYKNRFKDSNGAWIRSEIWACLCPGHPEIAVKYAVEDSCVDHADEGIYSEVFTVALESAAFAESDKFKLIDIALSYIPENSGCARAVRKIIEIYRSGVDWKSARIEILRAFPDSFGGQLGDVDPNVENGNWGYDAPANLAITLMGWLYAGDDFGRAICITAGCGEDGDCTTGALGALMGILLGADKIPDKWSAPIGEEIKTICVNKFASAIKTPKTLTELVSRTARLVPAFIGKYFDITSDNAPSFDVFEGEELFAKPYRNMDEANGWENHYFRDEIESGFLFRAESPIVRSVIEAVDGIDINPGDRIKMRVTLKNTFGHASIPLQAKFHWHTPAGISVEGGGDYTVFLSQFHCGSGYSVHEITLEIGEIFGSVQSVVCEIGFSGMPASMCVPIKLIHSR